jgi:nucleoside-diphosphate-sugar epimerase
MDISTSIDFTHPWIGRMLTLMTKLTNNQVIAVVGAGQIGTPVVQRLAALGARVTWISRTRPRELPAGVTHKSVDASDPVALARAIDGATAVIAAVNPATYDAQVWRETLPPLWRGLIEAVAKVGVRLVLLDALYLYALDRGPLAPQTAQTPSTQKGRVRKQISDMLAEAQAQGRVRATVLRASDFWGPDLTAALFTSEGIAGLKAGKRPFLLGDPDQPHAFSHRDDVVNGLVNLALAEPDVEGQVFHAPVVHVAPRALLTALTCALGVEVRPFVAPAWLLSVFGLFSKPMRGLVEMLPQWQAPYMVDDRAYCQRFGVEAISVADGVAQLARL